MPSSAAEAWARARVRREGPRDEIKAAVQARGHAVDAADERALAAANHT